ncbi:MAG: glycosyltransferase family 39 protein [Phycisphaerae bacterium]|jgi:4-amino-4-deoxy-L-arabinose transferase-like glycosyltransferase
MTQQPATDATQNDATSRTGWRARDWLVIALIVGAVLRVGLLDQPAGGLNQDEAANAWNAQCLLKTGRDQAGAAWPIFCMRALGENRVTPQIYAVLAFQAVGGMNVWTTRLPIALGGVATIALLYCLASRLFGRTVGAAAAVLLALNPWHVQLSRLCYGASLTPLLLTVALAAMVWAGLPLGQDGGRARVGRALVAGLVTGAACYGYFALRLVLPLLLIAIVIVGWRGWWELLRTRGRAAVGTFVLGVALTAGPLVWQHIAHPDEMLRRGTNVVLWQPGATAGEVAHEVASRYLGHFGPDFLFLRGDHQIVNSVPGVGVLHWYALPLLIAGLVVIIRRLWRSPAARVLLAWVILYPVGDCLAQAESMHALRSAPGLCGLILLMAVGGAALIDVARRWRPAMRRVAAVAAATLILAGSARFCYAYYYAYPRQPDVYHVFYVDLLEACAYLRPRLAEYDAVYVTTDGMAVPYIVTLFGLQYPPAWWLSGDCDVDRSGEWDQYRRYGKIHFIYDEQAIEELQALRENGRVDRIALVLRPDQAAPVAPSLVTVDPDGGPTMAVYEVDW